MPSRFYVSVSVLYIDASGKKHKLGKWTEAYEVGNRNDWIEVK